MKLAQFFKQAYPFYYRQSSLWKVAGIIFLFAFGFYYFFQPFEINTDEHKYGFFWISLIHAIIPGILLLIQGHIYQRRLQREDQWTVSKEFTFFGIFLLIVGTAQFLIRDLIYVNHENWSFKYLIEEVSHTFLIGGIFVAIAIPMNFNRLYARNVQHAQSLLIEPPTKPESQQLRIKTQVKSESFVLDIEKFLFARSDRNYLELFILNESTATKQLKRLSIKELLDQITTSGNFMQTHRSYLVNLDKIETVKGNAQGYTLTFKKCNETAVVSRNRIREFELRLK